MNLLAPLGLALGLTIPVVVLFYLLKVRRRDQEVSSTFLWNDLVRDLAAHEPLQRLKWSVLLVVQLLLLGLLTLALARPFVEHVGEKPVHAVLLLDGSASMQAQDVAPSRFARAVDAAKQALGGLPDNSVATVIVVAAHPQVLVAATPDRRQAERALDDARPSGVAGNMREALLLARSLGGDPASRRIHVFTDRAFSLPTDLPEDLGAVQVVQAASDAGNLALTAIAARPDPSDNRRRHLFARLENFSDAPARATLAVAVDGQVVDERPVEVAANGKLEQVFEELPAGARAASASLTPEGSANALAADDSAFSVLVQRKPAQALLVSNGNPYLEKMLSLLPNVELYRIPARRYLAMEVDPFDVVVFDDYLPPLLPRGNLLVVNPPDRGPIRTSGEVLRPRVATWERDDPLLAYVDMRELSIERARKLDLPRWAKSLVATDDGTPLLAAGQEGDRRVAIIPFDLGRSNLPRSPAFPILMSNLLAYLSRSGVVASPEIRTGEPQTLAPLPQVEQVLVIGPDERSLELKAGSGPLTYAATDRPGLYRVQQLVAGGGQTVDEDLFAANLADPDESNVRPRAEGLASAGAQVSEWITLRKEAWGLLAALALPLLLFEWFWFHRRA
jgi:Ca-activated chloride channel family protein